jgi:hypothetical protein
MRVFPGALLRCNCTARRNARVAHNDAVSRDE